MADFVNWGLTDIMGRTVVDNTGIVGKFDVHLEWAPDETAVVTQLTATEDPGKSTPTAEPSGPSIFTALEKLGLHLESGKAPSEFLIIDHAERPSGN